MKNIRSYDSASIQDFLTENNSIGKRLKNDDILPSFTQQRNLEDSRFQQDPKIHS